MNSSVGIDIAAPPATVFALARDVSRWERLLPHYRRSRVLARRSDGSVVAEFVAQRPFVPWLGWGLLVAWRSRVWDDPATLGLSFVHLAGVTSGMNVRWTLDPTPDGGTRVTISHAFSPSVPALAAVVDAVFTRQIAGRTLATFKAIAEALTDDHQSELPAPTNPPT